MGIQNEDPEAVGFEVSIDRIDIETCCDKLRIEGDECSYGKHTTTRTSSVKVRGDNLNITWTSDGSSTGPGFDLTVSSLYYFNKTDCYDYTCDDESGRCFRIHYDDYMMWNESQAACEEEGATLAVITDQDYERNILNIAHEDYGGFWIGITGHSLDSMEWTTGQSTHDYGYQNWKPDADEMFMNTDEGCGILNREGWPFVTVKKHTHMFVKDRNKASFYKLYLLRE